MTDREKLMQLIESAACAGPEGEAASCPDRRDGVCTETRKLSACAIGHMADHLQASGVVILEQGRWDEIPNSYISISSKDGSYSGHATSCSVCREVNPNAFKTNYCPNCGAKMVQA